MMRFAREGSRVVATSDEGVIELPVAEWPCQWFALCENTAEDTEPHPVLGDVPVCPRCKAKVAALA